MGELLQLHQRLEEGQVHLWHSYVQKFDGIATASSMALLTLKERSLYQHFIFEKDKRRYLLTRVLIRTILSKYLPIEPQNLIFENNKYGRPYIANNDPRARLLHFNISHTDSIIFIAVTTRRELGIDVENTNRSTPFEVSDNFFSRQELNALSSLPMKAKSNRFWELWTLKESYTKARGIGLSLPLNQFSFHFQDDYFASINFDAGFDDRSDRWLFLLLKPDAENIVAICIEKICAGMLTFVSYEITPLQAMSNVKYRFLRGSENYENEFKKNDDAILK